MPWKLRKAPKRDLYWVVDDKGKHYSKEPMPKDKAREQQKALYAAEGRKHGSGDAEDTVESVLKHSGAFGEESPAIPPSPEDAPEAAGEVSEGESSEEESPLRAEAPAFVPKAARLKEVEAELRSMGAHPNSYKPTRVAALSAEQRAKAVKLTQEYHKLKGRGKKGGGMSEAAKRHRERIKAEAMKESSMSPEQLGQYRKEKAASHQASVDKIVSENEEKARKAAEWNAEMERRKNSPFAPVVQGLTKLGDVAAKYGSYVGMPKVVSEAYKQFAPPGSEFHKGSGKEKASPLEKAVLKKEAAAEHGARLAALIPQKAAAMAELPEHRGAFKNPQRKAAEKDMAALFGAIEHLGKVHTKEMGKASKMFHGYGEKKGGMKGIRELKKQQAAPAQSAYQRYKTPTAAERTHARIEAAKQAEALRKAEEEAAKIARQRRQIQADNAARVRAAEEAAARAAEAARAAAERRAAEIAAKEERKAAIQSKFVAREAAAKRAFSRNLAAREDTSFPFVEDGERPEMRRFDKGYEAPGEAAGSPAGTFAAVHSKKQAFSEGTYPSPFPKIEAQRAAPPYLHEAAEKRDDAHIAVRALRQILKDVDEGRTGAPEGRDKTELAHYLYSKWLGGEALDEKRRYYPGNLEATSSGPLARLAPYGDLGSELQTASFDRIKEVIMPRLEALDRDIEATLHDVGSMREIEKGRRGFGLHGGRLPYPAGSQNEEDFFAWARSVMADMGTNPQVYNKQLPPQEALHYRQLLSYGNVNPAVAAYDASPQAQELRARVQAQMEQKRAEAAARREANRPWYEKALIGFSDPEGPVYGALRKAVEYVPGIGPVVGKIADVGVPLATAAASMAGYGHARFREPAYF